jgi:hypothetical protein
MGMDHSAPILISFVITIRAEEQDDRHKTARWYGRITNVQTEEYAYFTNMSGIKTFITLYLRDVGVTTSFWWRLRDWLRGRA